MNQESVQDFHAQEIPSANSHEYGGSDSAVPLHLNVNGGGFTVLQLPQVPTSSAIADPAIKPPLRKCSSCGFGSSSAKKRSPPPSFSLSSLYQPSSKRPAFSPNHSSPDPTPPSSSERKMQRTPLHRSLSDFPYCYQDFPNPAAAAASFLKNASSPSQMVPGNSKISPISLLDSFPMTTMVPGQHSSLSNPSSSSEYYEQTVNITPPRPAPFVRPQMLDHHHGSPNSKKLKRELKGKVQEMMQLMDQAVSQQQQDDHDDDDDDDDDVNCINKEKAEMMNQNPNPNPNPKEGGHDSKVWVKQTEGGLILHFDCPCGEDYEVFLHGDKCYYRLD